MDRIFWRFLSCILGAVLMSLPAPGAVSVGPAPRPGNASIAPRSGWFPAWSWGRRPMGNDGASRYDAIAAELGLSAQEDTPQLARDLGQRWARGVVVTSILPDGPAAVNGVHVGEFIVGVNGRLVENVTEYRQEMVKADAKLGVALNLQTLDGKYHHAIIRSGRET
ncbi:MAG: PDZ domain-containing protein [Planctomycetota bacterium]